MPARCGRDLVRGFDRWVDLADMSDDAAANRIRNDGIDVLVELKGHTVGNRLGIVCRRPAPIQIHYLGFPGTLGLDAISHLVADAVVIPAGEEAAYQETLLRMPHCYQVSDDRRALPAVPARSALGLPDEAIVHRLLQPDHKLSRAFFRLWVQAMREVPQDVLWLYVPHEITQRNLRREAEREGLDPARIVFAPNAPNEAHIARLRTRRSLARPAALRIAHDRQRRAVGRGAAALVPRRHVRGAGSARACSRRSGCPSS